MQDWLPVADDYLEILVQHEGYPGDRVCQKGCGREGNWRCLDCFGKPLFCTECCRSEHSRHPFHRVEVWCGRYFAPSSLSAVGVVLHLAHGGLPCPNAQDDGWEDDPDDPGEDGIDDSGLGDHTESHAFNDILSSLGHGNEQSHRKKRYDANGNPLITVVDRSGIHCLIQDQSSFPTLVTRRTHTSCLQSKASTVQPNPSSRGASENSSSRITNPHIGTCTTCSSSSIAIGGVLCRPRNAIARNQN
jgi:hypothetical protein